MFAPVAYQADINDLHILEEKHRLRIALAKGREKHNIATEFRRDMFRLETHIDPQFRLSDDTGQLFFHQRIEFFIEFFQIFIFDGHPRRLGVSAEFHK